jgi:hypothetical protein
MPLLALLALAPVHAFAADAAPKPKADASAKVTPKTDAAPAPDAKATPTSAPAVPATVDEAVSTFQGIVRSFSSEHVRAGIAGCICLLVFLWRRFGEKFLIGKIPSRFLPLLTAGVAFLAALPIAIMVTPWCWKAFVWQGLVTSAEAAFFWGLILKFIFPIPEKK